MSAHEGQQKRNFFRLEYLKPHRPTIEITKRQFEIIDLSERGVKFELPRNFEPKEKARVSGKVHLADDKVYEVIGYVLRVNLEKKECVLYLEEGLPLKAMLEEQRRLIQQDRQ